jgi:PhzF family phenazine biosynthesis protein
VTKQLLRYAAFPAGEGGGNPAGVVLDAHGMSRPQMLAVAADVGFSETAFLFPESAPTDRADHPEGVWKARVRYFSPLAEVPFCGHATIATAVAHAERHGTGRLDLDTPAGPVPVETQRQDGLLLATLTSVNPSTLPMPAELLNRVLGDLGWSEDLLDVALPPRVCFAGAHHPVLVVRSRQVLAELDYDYEALAAIMAEHDWTTMQLVQREKEDVFHARNPFPPGGVIEDPATGAAAAALGGYLRWLDQVPASRRVSIHQGYDMGRPSLLGVEIPVKGGIKVSGSAIRLSSVD